MKLWEDKALKSETEKEFVQAKSLVNSKAIRYFSLVKASEKAPAEEADANAEKLSKAFAEAVSAVKTRDEKQAAYLAAHPEDATAA